MQKAKCTNCNDRCRDRSEFIPYAVYEVGRARDERIFMKLWIIILILILLLVGSNIGWLIYEAQFETVEEITQDVTQEADNGENYFIGGDLIGETDGKNNENYNPPT